jgi:hypothetical protein
VEVQTSGQEIDPELGFVETLEEVMLDLEMKFDWLVLKQEVVSLEEDDSWVVEYYPVAGD